MITITYIIQLPCMTIVVHKQVRDCPHPKKRGTVTSSVDILAGLNQERKISEVTHTHKHTHTFICYKLGIHTPHYQLFTNCKASFFRYVYL